MRELWLSRDELARHRDIAPGRVLPDSAIVAAVLADPKSVTARGLLAVIRALDEETRRQGLQLVDIMAVASDDYGTLRRRLVGTPLEGAVVAKTGTLVHDDGGMASLGGIVYTRKYGKVCFVMLNQGSSVAESRAMTDQLLSEIILSQDTPAPIPMPDKPRHMLESSDLEVTEQ